MSFWSNLNPFVFFTNVAAAVNNQNASTNNPRPTVTTPRPTVPIQPPRSGGGFVVGSTETPIGNIQVPPLVIGTPRNEGGESPNAGFTLPTGIVIGTRPTTPTVIDDEKKINAWLPIGLIAAIIGFFIWRKQTKKKRK